MTSPSARGDRDVWRPSEHGTIGWLRHPWAAYRSQAIPVQLFWPLLAVYVALTVAVMLRTPVLDVDTWIRHMRLRGRYDAWAPFWRTYELLGQRGPTTIAALPWLAWLAHRRRTAQPLLLFGVALIVLNLSVGVVKIATGRLGPRAFHATAHALFAGGNIYPSGHVANTVVLYGVIAMVAAPQYRRITAAVGSFITVTVGTGTLFLNTHWVTDVVGGILAGALALLSLHWLMPPAQRWFERVVAAVRRRRRQRRAAEEIVSTAAAGHSAADRAPAADHAHRVGPVRTGSAPPTATDSARTKAATKAAS